MCSSSVFLRIIHFRSAFIFQHNFLLKYPTFSKGRKSNASPYSQNLRSSKLPILHVHKGIKNRNDQNSRPMRIPNRRKFGLFQWRTSIQTQGAKISHDAPRSLTLLYLKYIIVFFNLIANAAKTYCIECTDSLV